MTKHREGTTYGVPVGMFAMALIAAVALLFSPGVWPLAVAAFLWAVYYALRPLTLRSLVIQFVTVWLVMVVMFFTTWSDLAGSLVIHLGAALLFAVGFFALWMVPVGLAASFLASGRAPSSARPNALKP
ncbi:MAG: hypothetical protein Q4G35_04290 [Propionibacteriaceae bacterium]|nr:hypothetical protein [Propionibacteriaceae bacterium]